MCVENEPQMEECLCCLGNCQGVCRCVYCQSASDECHEYEESCNENLHCCGNASIGRSDR